MVDFRVLAAAAAVSLSACSGMPTSTEGVTSGIERFRVAFNKQDAAGVAAEYASDGKILPPGRPMIVGKERIQAFWQGSFAAGLTSITKKPVDLVVAGDLAVETSTYVVVHKGQEISGKDTLVWRRGADNVWIIVSDIWNNDK